MRFSTFRRAAVAFVAALALGVGGFSTAPGAAAAAKPLPPGSAAMAKHFPPSQGNVGTRLQAAATGDDGSICYYGACYNYVSGRQYADASGASVQLWTARPELDAADYDAHSLQELAVQSADASQIVEIGWTVDRQLNGDLAPHLFVFHWVDGVPTCYNGCGFVPTSTAVTPGMELPSGSLGTFRINHVRDRWELSLDGIMFGYFPDALWQGRYTRLGLVQAFGEVASTTAPACDDMGTGKFADSAASSRITGFRLLDSATPVGLSMLVTSPGLYDDAAVTPSSFRLGGPGTGRC